MNENARVASEYIYEVHAKCQSIFNNELAVLDPLVQFVIRQLYCSCHLTSESALLLLDNGRVWDADILNRSIAEGLVKYAFILTAESNEKRSLASEYWETMPDNLALRRSDRAREVLEAAKGRGDPKWKPLEDLVLSDTAIQEILEKSNRRDRKALEQKWSFTEILKHFAASKDHRLEPLALMTYNYGMNSHLVHKDGDGVGMIWERQSRDSVRRMAVTEAHVARNICDICIFTKLRHFYLANACNVASSSLDDLSRKYESLFASLELLASKFIDIEYSTCGKSSVLP